MRMMSHLTSETLLLSVSFCKMLISMQFSLLHHCAPSHCWLSGCLLVHHTHSVDLTVSQQVAHLTSDHLQLQVIQIVQYIPQASLSFPTCRYLRNITIPAAFVTKTTGDALKTLVAKKGTSQEEVIVVMDWTDALPRADKVEWEFWTNSNDQCGAVCDVQKEFIKVRRDQNLWFDHQSCCLPSTISRHAGLTCT